MNPASIKTKQDAEKARKEYLTNLHLEVSNLQRVQNALDQLEDIGITAPVPPEDRRTTTEKLADTEMLKTKVFQELLAIMDGDNALKTIKMLTEAPFILRLVANRMNDIVAHFQRTNQLGVSASVFRSYIKDVVEQMNTKELKELGFEYTPKTSKEPSKPAKEAPEPVKPKSVKKEPKAEPKPEPQSVPIKEEPKPESSKPVKIKKSIKDKTKSMKRDEEMKKEQKQAQKEDKISSKASERRQQTINTAREKLEVQKQKMEAREKTRKMLDEDLAQAKKEKQDARRQTREATRKKKKEEEIEKRRMTDTIPPPTSQNRQEMLDYLVNLVDMGETLTLTSSFKWTPKRLQTASTSTLEQLYNKYQGSSSGAGMKKPKKGNIIFGKGLKVNRKKAEVDISKAVRPTETYSQFGRYLINNHKLNDDILMIRSAKGGSIPSMKTQKVSKPLIKVISKIMKEQTLDYEDIDGLNTDEREHLHTILANSHLSDKFKVPCKSIDEDNNRFEILKNQILAGQNNPDAIKEFKLLVVKLMNQGRLPRRQGNEILQDLTSLGY
jgi:chemotaxis protein histidine kinase CheA